MPIGNRHYCQSPYLLLKRTGQNETELPAFNFTTKSWRIKPPLKYVGWQKMKFFCEKLILYCWNHYGRHKHKFTNLCSGPYFYWKLYKPFSQYTICCCLPFNPQRNVTIQRNYEYMRHFLFYIINLRFRSRWVYYWFCTSVKYTAIIGLNSKNRQMSATETHFFSQVQTRHLGSFP